MIKYSDGILEVRENNYMSLSCKSKIVVQNGIIKDIYLSGMPRANGVDRWFTIMSKLNCGDKITDDFIKKMLDCDGACNIKAEWIESEVEENDS